MVVHIFHVTYSSTENKKKSTFFFFFFLGKEHFQPRYAPVKQNEMHSLPVMPAPPPWAPMPRFDIRLSTTTVVPALAHCRRPPSMRLSSSLAQLPHPLPCEYDGVHVGWVGLDLRDRWGHWVNDAAAGRGLRACLGELKILRSSCWEASWWESGEAGNASSSFSRFYKYRFLESE